MRKVLLFIALLSAVLTAGAKGDVKVINRDCTLSGGIFALCKAAKVSPQDAIVYNAGAKWYIENHRINNDNYISFWVEEDESAKKEYNYWKKNDVAVYIVTSENGKKSYAIRDDMFSYLTIIEIQENVFLIQLYTKELNK